MTERLLAYSSDLVVNLAAALSCFGWPRSESPLLSNAGIWIVCPPPSVGRPQPLYCPTEEPQSDVSVDVTNAEEQTKLSSAPDSLYDSVFLCSSIGRGWTTGPFEHPTLSGIRLLRSLAWEDVFSSFARSTAASSTT